MINKNHAMEAIQRIYYPSCAGIPDPSCSDCPTKELGRVRSIFLKRTDYKFLDITNPLEWVAAINARNVYVFPYTKGSLEIVENMQDGFGNVDQDLMSYSFTLNAMDPQFPNNCDFWNAIKHNNNYQVGYRTETKIYMSDVGATIIPKAPIADDLKSRVVWNITFKFIQEDIPCPKAIPNEIFTVCLLPS